MSTPIYWIIFFVMTAGLGFVIFLLQRERQGRRNAERELSDLDARMRNLSKGLEETRARLETTFSGMMEGVLLTDQRGEILHVNPAFHGMFGLKGKVEGRSALEVLASVHCDDAIHKVLETGKPVEQEVEFQNPRRRVFQVHFSPMRKDGRLFGVVSVFHDLTEIRRLEQVRRDFVANLSHELKTPLTAICGYSETLLDESSSDLPQNSRKQLEIIFRHSTELSRLMENLLNLSRIESGREEIRLEPIPIRNFVNQLFERFAAQAKIKGIDMRNEIAENTSTVQADSGKLNQILSNLLDNALKYTPEKGSVWIRGKLSGEGYLLEVCDNGPGIPPGDRERIFERFYRVDKARSRDSGGTGIGLAIVKHLVELHGGRITVESAPGKGAQFKITIPQST